MPRLHFEGRAVRRLCVHRAPLPFILILCAALLAAGTVQPRAAHADSQRKTHTFQLFFNRQFPPNIVYDIALPYLIRARLFGEADNLSRRVHKAQEFINFLATPGEGPKYAGLGTAGSGVRGNNYANYGLMLASGNMLCSEQAFAAANMFGDKHHISRTDVVSHTFAEVANGRRWFMLDPMFNPDFKDPESGLASLDSVRAYVDGDETALAVNKPLPPRINSYLDLFRASDYEAPPDKPERTFGFRAMIPAVPCEAALRLPFKKFLAQYQPLSPEADKGTEAYVAYLRCNFGKFADTASKERVFRLQDMLLGRVRKFWTPDTEGRDLSMDEYEGRQYQFLGRYGKAMAAFSRVPETKRVALYKAQVHYDRKDIREFMALADKLGDSPYYRDMYYRLVGKYLRPGDKAFFASFPYRGPGAVHMEPGSHVARY